MPPTPSSPSTSGEEVLCDKDLAPRNYSQTFEPKVGGEGGSCERVESAGRGGGVR